MSSNGKNRKCRLCGLTLVGRVTKQYLWRIAHPETYLDALESVRWEKHWGYPSEDAVNWDFTKAYQPPKKKEETFVVESEIEALSDSKGVAVAMVWVQHVFPLVEGFSGAIRLSPADASILRKGVVLKRDDHREYEVLGVNSETGYVKLDSSDGISDGDFLAVLLPSDGKLPGLEFA